MPVKLRVKAWVNVGSENVREWHYFYYQIKLIFPLKIVFFMKNQKNDRFLFPYIFTAKVMIFLPVYATLFLELKKKYFFSLSGAARRGGRHSRELEFNGPARSKYFNSQTGGVEAPVPPVRQSVSRQLFEYLRGSRPSPWPTYLQNSVRGK